MTTFRIYPLLCGHVINHECSSFVYRRDYGGRRFDAPCTAWLLRGGSEDILVDTGPGPQTRAPQHYRKDDAAITEHLPNALNKLDSDPARIRTVILTHLHNDHVGGAHLFPNAHFHVQEAELREAVWPVPFQRPIYEINQPGRTPPWTTILDRMTVHTGDSDITPGLRAILLPGHTGGSQGVLVNTEAGPYLLPGDLVPLYDNWPADGPPIPNGNHTDLYAYERSFQRLRQLAAHILPSHDPRVFDRPCYP
jgi:glyoxylase-like metal-dependent hydrolase (beta-lactamase superfamily II)